MIIPTKGAKTFGGRKTYRKTYRITYRKGRKACRRKTRGHVGGYLINQLHGHEYLINQLRSEPPNPQLYN